MILAGAVDPPPAALPTAWVLAACGDLASQSRSDCGNDFYLAAKADSPLPLRAHLRLGVLRN